MLYSRNAMKTGGGGGRGGGVQSHPSMQLRSSFTKRVLKRGALYRESEGARG